MLHYSCNKLLAGATNCINYYWLRRMRKASHWELIHNSALLPNNLHQLWLTYKNLFVLQLTFHMEFLKCLYGLYISSTTFFTPLWLNTSELRPERGGKIMMHCIVVLQIPKSSQQSLSFLIFLRGASPLLSEVQYTSWGFLIFNRLNKWPWFWVIKLKLYPKSECCFRQS